MKQMYKGKAFSPNATITKAIGPTDTIIEVDNAEAFPPGPNLATIGTDELGETILYSQVVDNKLSGCTRGIEGTAKSWLANEIIARNFTNEDLERLIDNINSLDGDKVDNSKVLTDVPANAKFTDTTYSEIPTAEIDTGTSSTLRTITARRLKYVIDKIQDEINNLNKTDVGLGNVDNTSDMDKPISTKTQAALNSKVDNSRVLTDVPVDAKFTDTVIDVVDNLTTGDTTKALSAKQGKDLKGYLDAHEADYASFKNNIEAIRYVGEKIELKINGEWIEFKSGSQYPVGNVSGLKADEDDMQVTINWIDPPDLTIEDSLGNLITLSKLAGTQLRRKKLSYPSSENDGELVVDSKIRNQYEINGYVDDGLVNDEEYFYMLFPYTEDGVFTVDSANRISATPTEIDPDTWSGIQKIIRKGLASEFFEVGDQIASNYDGGEIIWEVIGIDIDTPADSQFEHSMTIQTRDCLHDIQFDAPEPSNPDSNRKDYGNNRYVHSAVKQWLNSDEAKFNWQSQHQYDAKPNNSLELYNGPGFLNKLDPELKAVIGPVRKNVAKNTVTDSGGQESFTDKVFLLSQKEVDLGNEGVNAGEVVYPFYTGVANAARIKNLNGSPRSWWLRSPHVGNSHNVRNVSTSGAFTNYHANHTSGVSPACVII